MTDSLLFWNDVAIEADRVRGPGDKQGQSAEGVAPALAIIHLAMYDAYVAVARPADFAPHLPALPAAPAGASADAAIAGAAHEILTALFPGQRGAFDRKLAEAGVPAGDPGQAFGRLVASAHLEARAGEAIDGDEGEPEPAPPPERRHVEPAAARGIRTELDAGIDPGAAVLGVLGPFWTMRMKRYSLIARRAATARPFHNHKAFRVLRAVRRQGFGWEPAVAVSRQLPA